MWVNIIQSLRAWVKQEGGGQASSFFLSLLELGCWFSPALGHQSSWFWGLGNPRHIPVAPPVLSWDVDFLLPLDIRASGFGALEIHDIYQGPPGSQSFIIWTELYHWLSWFSILHIANMGPLCLHEHVANAYNHSVSCFSGEPRLNTLTIHRPKPEWDATSHPLGLVFKKLEDQDWQEIGTLCSLVRMWNGTTAMGNSSGSPCPSTLNMELPHDPKVLLHEKQRFRERYVHPHLQ